MPVVVRCPLLACGKLTGWSYPSFEWARSHVDGVPPRSFIHVRTLDRGHVMGMRDDDPCPDPFGHVNQFRQGRDRFFTPLVPEARYAVDEEPVDDPNEGEDEAEEVWSASPTFPWLGDP